jgi:hypothetical protein
MLNRVADLLVLSTCLLWTVAVLFGLRRQQRFLISFLVTACLAGALQTAASDFRWQMVPAYVFLILATLRATLDLSATVGLPVARWKKVTARTLLVIMTAIVIALPVMIFPRITYLKPTGPYPVGVRSEYWVDSTRSETLPARRMTIAGCWWRSGAPPIRAGMPTAFGPPRRMPLPGVGGVDAGGIGVRLQSMATGLTWARADQPVSGADGFPLPSSRTVWRHPDPERVRNGGARQPRHIIASTSTASPPQVPSSPTAPRGDGQLGLTVLSTDSIRCALILAADGRFIIDRCPPSTATTRGSSSPAASTRPGSGTSGMASAAPPPRRSCRSTPGCGPGSTWTGIWRVRHG